MCAYKIQVIAIVRSIDVVKGLSKDCVKSKGDGGNVRKVLTSTTI